MRDPEDADAVASRADFLAYAEWLAADWEASEARDAAGPSAPWSPGQRGWENASIGNFLEALVAYARDAAVDERPSWRTFAQLLRAGKGYE